MFCFDELLNRLASSGTNNPMSLTPSFLCFDTSPEFIFFHERVNSFCFSPHLHKHNHDHLYANHSQQRRHVIRLGSVSPSRCCPLTHPHLFVRSCYFLLLLTFPVTTTNQSHSPCRSPTHSTSRVRLYHLRNHHSASSPNKYVSGSGIVHGLFRYSSKF